MVQFVDKLSPCVKGAKTKKRKARKLHQASIGVTAPIALLFEDSPQAVGLEPFEAYEAASGESVKEFQARFRLPRNSGSFRKPLFPIKSVGILVL